jgi:DNA-binding NarL/FixJ family response regulator
MEGMRQANLSFDVEFIEEWEVFDEAGVLDAEIISCDGDRGVTRIHVEAEVDERRLDAVDTIEWWNRVVTADSKHVYLFESDVGDLVDTSDADVDGLPRAESLDVTSEGPRVTCAGSQAQISALVAEAEANGIDVTLERLHDYRTGDTVLETLTPRQREVLEVAFDRGYYDVPRAASASEVAAELDIDDSTVSEHLQRAERNLLELLLG